MPAEKTNILNKLGRADNVFIGSDNDPNSYQSEAKYQFGQK